MPRKATHERTRQPSLKKSSPKSNQAQRAHKSTSTWKLNNGKNQSVNFKCGNTQSNMRINLKRRKTEIEAHSASKRISLNMERMMRGRLYNTTARCQSYFQEKIKRDVTQTARIKNRKTFLRRTTQDIYPVIIQNQARRSSHAQAHLFATRQQIQQQAMSCKNLISTKVDSHSSLNASSLFMPTEKGGQ